jgi:hypothetical protein
MHERSWLDLVEHCNKRIEMQSPSNGIYQRLSLSTPSVSQEWVSSNSSQSFRCAAMMAANQEWAATQDCLLHDCWLFLVSLASCDNAIHTKSHGCWCFQYVGYSRLHTVFDLQLSFSPFSSCPGPLCSRPMRNPDAREPLRKYCQMGYCTGWHIVR